MGKLMIRQIKQWRWGKAWWCPGWFYFFALFFLFVGLFFIADVSLAEGRLHFHDSFFFIKRQLIWFILGFFAFLAGRFGNWRLWRRFAPVIYFLNLLFLLLVLIPGLGHQVWGARRWLALGPFLFQPAELVKFSLLLYLSALFSREKEPTPFFLLVISLPAVILVAAEPDLGTSLVLVLMSLALYFAIGAKMKQLLILGLLVLTATTLFIASSRYRRQRVVGFLNPFRDPLGTTYHSYQLAQTLASGGWWGRGFGQSRQKYRTLPQVTTDSILAVIGEEIGFLGLAILLTFFFVWILLLLFYSLRFTGPGRIFGLGLTVWLAGQGFLNASSAAILLPFTGVPFPLISYGGSALFVLLLALGIYINFYRQEKCH